jgi:hypothetical protein
MSARGSEAAFWEAKDELLGEFGANSEVIL